MRWKGWTSLEHFLANLADKILKKIVKILKILKIMKWKLERSGLRGGIFNSDYKNVWCLVILVESRLFFGGGGYILSRVFLNKISEMRKSKHQNL